MKFPAVFIVAFLASLVPLSSHAKTWNGLEIAPEDTCTPYKRHHYYYRSNLEPDIVNYSDLAKGEIYSPYSDEYFSSFKQTDIEHIVSLKEAHDSGLCDKPRSIKIKFANDLLNLTLASPSVNRWQKSSKDLGEWQPEHNRCWYLDRIIKVKQKYNLSIDEAEYKAMTKLASICLCYPKVN